MKTLKEMLAEARQVVPEQGTAELKQRLDAGEPVTLIDVRDPDEYRDGFIEPATNISRGFLEFRIGGAVTDHSAPIVLYCQTGLRSMLAARALRDLGYANVVNLQGGFQKWAQSGLPVVKDRPLTTEQIQRYSRHFLLNQVEMAAVALDLLRGQRPILDDGQSGLRPLLESALEVDDVGVAEISQRSRRQHRAQPGLAVED